MEYRKIAESAGLKVYAVIMSQGDEAVAELIRFAQAEGLGGAQISGIGAASGAELAWLDFEARQYRPFSVEGQVEVVSLLGDFTFAQDGTPHLHAHVTLGKRDGSLCGGHLLRLDVRPTLELIVTETPAQLRRRADPGMPVATIRLSESS